MILSLPPVGIPHAMVVRSESDDTPLSPTFINKNAPVPYVFFAIPGAKAACPNSAAC